MQIKIIRYHYESIRTAKIQDTDNTKCWEDVEQQELPFTAGGNANGIVPLEDGLATISFLVFKKSNNNNIFLSYDPAIALLGIYPKELKMYVHTKTCI